MSIQLQKQIKNNSEDLVKYVNDLFEWEDDKDTKPQAKKKQKAKKKIKRKVRNQDLKEELEEIKEVAEEEQKKNVNLIRDKTTIKDYYDAWDKLDIVHPQLLQSN